MLIIRTYCYGTGPGTSTRSVGKVSIASNQKDVTYCNISIKEKNSLKKSFSQVSQFNFARYSSSHV